MSTIKLSDSTLIDSASLKIGVNTNNKLSENKYTGNGAGTISYTATADCWAFTTGYVDKNRTLNGITTGYAENTRYVGIPIFLKKGDKLVIAGNHYEMDAHYIAYGVK